MMPFDEAGCITQGDRDKARSTAMLVLAAVKQNQKGLVESSCRTEHYSVVSAMRTLNIVGSCQEAVADACFNLVDKDGEGFLRVWEDGLGDFWLWFDRHS